MASSTLAISGLLLRRPRVSMAPLTASVSSMRASTSSSCHSIACAKMGLGSSPSLMASSMRSMALFRTETLTLDRITSWLRASTFGLQCWLTLHLAQERSSCPSLASVGLPHSGHSSIPAARRLRELARRRLRRN